MSRLGNSIVGGAQRLGHAVHKGVDSAVRLVDKVAPKVEAIAGKVETYDCYGVWTTLLKAVAY